MLENLAMASQMMLSVRELIHHFLHGLLDHQHIFFVGGGFKTYQRIPSDIEIGEETLSSFKIRIDKFNYLQSYCPRQRFSFRLSVIKPQIEVFDFGRYLFYSKNNRFMKVHSFIE